MNCTNHTQNHPDLTHQITLLLFTVPTFFIGSALNGTALYTICCAIKQRTKPFVYMVNLVISDTLLLFSLPFKVYAFYVKEDWILKMKKSFCQFLESLCFVNNYTSILVITLICVDRYVAVIYPFNARTNSSPRKVAGICGFIWITVCICTIHIYFQSQSKSCFYFISADVLRLEFIVPLGVLVLICAFTMLFCSLRIIHSLTSQASETLDGYKDKCIKILLSNLFTFLICFMPYHTALLLYSLAVNGFLSKFNCEHLRLALHYTLYLANVNCCLDAIYYFFAIKEVRRSQQIPDKKIQMDVCDTSMGSTVHQSQNSHSQ